MREIIVFYWGGGYAKLSMRGRVAWTERTVRKVLARMRLDNLTTNKYKHIASAVADDYVVNARHYA